MTNSQSKIPQLRFPEFTDEWIEKELKELGYFIGGGTPKTKENKYWNGGILWFTPTDITSNYVLNSNRTISESGLSNSSAKLIPKNSILITTRASIGKLAICKQDYTTNQGFQSLVVNDKNNNIYIYNWFKLKKHLLIKKANGSTFLEISKKSLEKIIINIPSFNEQEKIATFLTAIDKRIELLTAQKEQFELYKKGLMQKLFSQEIRFKDENGNPFTDWKEKNLGEIGNTYNGLTGKTKADFGKGKAFIQYMQIYCNSKIDIKECGLVNVTSTEKQNQVEYGDIFFTTSSETPNDIGISSVLTTEVKEMYLNSFCFGYRPNSLKELIPKFSQFYFRNIVFRKQIIKLAQGSTRYNISKRELMKVNIIIPSENEQIKISTTLTCLDKKCNTINKQITFMQIWKKGLLKQLFV